MTIEAKHDHLCAWVNESYRPMQITIVLIKGKTLLTNDIQ